MTYMDGSEANPLYAEFPEWSSDVIHKLLDLMQDGSAWPKVTRKIKTVRRQELKHLWAELVSKSEPPTFQKVLSYIKRWLEIRKSQFELCSQVSKPPKSFCICNSCGSITVKDSQCQRCKKELPGAGMTICEDRNSFPKMKGILWREQIRNKRKGGRKKRDS